MDKDYIVKIACFVSFEAGNKREKNNFKRAVVYINMFQFYIQRSWAPASPTLRYLTQLLINKLTLR
jgi:hypothetical protein